ALLAMLETFNIQSEPRASLPLRTIHRVQHLYFQMRNLLLSLSGGNLKFLSEKLRVEASRSRVRCHILWTRILKWLGPGREYGYQHLRIVTVNHEALAAYEPAPFDGRIVLFRPAAHYQGLNDRCFGWGTIARQGVRV